MKRLRYDDKRRARAGVVVGDGVVPLDTLNPQMTEVRQVVAGGPELLDRLRKAAKDAPKLELTRITDRLEGPLP